MKTNLSHIKGLGPKRLSALANQGLYTYEDFANWVPLRYLDLTKPSPKIKWDNGAWVLCHGIVEEIKLLRGKRPRLQIDVLSEGESVQLTFFSYYQNVEKKIALGDPLVFHGRMARYGNQWQMVHPEWDKGGEFTEKIKRFYSQPESLRLAKMDHKKLSTISKTVFANPTLTIPEILPDQIRNDLGFAPRLNVLKKMHIPKNMQDVYTAKRQLKLEELIPVSLRIAWRRKQMRSWGCSLNLQAEELEEAKGLFPFSLTEAQSNALAEIFQGLNSPYQYCGLIQGDVGCGKTAIAIAVSHMLIKKNKQVCLMAPTEILAQQLHQAFVDVFGALQVALLTSSTDAKSRSQTLAQLENHQLSVLVGTHSLLHDSVRFADIGLAIIDEQHRFGVEQRNKLLHKKDGLDMLALSATPIPRSLVRSFYGDLDSVVIGAKPANRQDVITRLVGKSKRDEMISWLLKEAQKDHRVFWVVPRVEEDPAAPSVESVFKELKSLGYDWSVGFIHGKLPEEQKSQVLDDFRSGALNVLVATTVIEVGVNVPEAAIIVIEGADRFGLAQLHQLRGRVGRGGQQGWCFLMSDAQDALTRLTEFANTTDGFAISELDLKNRGTGNIEGYSQSGIRIFKYFDFLQDMELVQEMAGYCSTLFQSEYLKDGEGKVYLQSCLLEGNSIQE
jgi:ATP-dependent DNA helicase RecG